MITPLLYSGLGLDRAHRLRRESDLARLVQDESARFVPYWRGRQLVAGTPPTALRLSHRHLPPGFDLAACPSLLLGVAEDESPVLAIDLSELDAGEDGPALADGTWVSLRSVGGLLPADDAALLAYARGMLIWRARTRHCSVCGGRLVVADAGHSTRCADESCAALHFPRTDPAIIMLVTDPAGRALLGRQPVWPPGMYSCLAGFVEPGESLEEAVAREVWEEAGIRIDSARYAASQPWPFPSSLMIGFTAMAAGGEPRPDRHEIEDARWFTRAEVERFGEAAAPGPDGHFLPSRDSIARRLIEDWRRG
jgi:NAD+ diphosphatase